MTMTRTEIETAIETRARVEGGDGEDHDTGWIVEMIDDDTVLVSWDSGVRTPCPIDLLSLI